MENVVGYDDYVEDFKSVALTSYYWLAEELLTEAWEEWEQLDNLEVHVSDYLTCDECGYTFLFDVQNEDKRGLVLSYTGFF